VTQVTEARRDEIRAILQRVPAARRPLIADALCTFAEAAGEPTAPPLAEFSV
jgi:hypothetical protein